MQILDLLIFLIYMLGLLGMGYYFMLRNKNQSDYFVGGRNIGKWHIGLSVVATDVGGGFSVGLGGLGYLIGLSGSWMLFTGLIGAILAAVFLIPAVKSNSKFFDLLTFPQVFEKIYGKKVAMVAAIISLIGYLGFTSSQLLAGAKLASGTIDGLNTNHALLLMGIVAVVYTVFGGLKAVIYTDTIQWIILLLGFFFIGIPFSFFYVGGWNEIFDALPAEFFRLDNITWQDLFNWGITIIPIWFIGMTLYQRIFASRDLKSAQKAWYIAGVFEWPIMAFMGVTLGLLSRIAYEKGLLIVTGSALDPEMAVPILLSQVLPTGILGLMLAAYFSAVLSTADSCLMAASGNLNTDILGKWTKVFSEKIQIHISQLFTFVLGFLALLIALKMENVLELMLYSYGFMVSGLLVPLLFGIFSKWKNPMAALFAMLGGGTVTLLLGLFMGQAIFGLSPNFYGLSVSFFIFYFVIKFNTIKK